MDEFIWIPDWNAQGSTRVNVAKVQYGDGYVQRQTKGMNPLGVTWTLAFNPSSDLEADAIEAFLEARKGVTAFTWTPPGKPQAKWTCDNWSRSKASFDVNSISLALEKVYEP